MDQLIKLALDINLGNLIVMGSMLWFLYSRIEHKFHQVDRRFDKIEHRLDKMQDAINDIDRRLCRLEGAFQAKDCCMIKNNQPMKLAE